MTSLMPTVAKLLGVEIGEKFRVEFKNDDYNNYYNSECFYFTENELVCEKGWISAIVLTELIRGTCTIVQKQWKPRSTDAYFIIDVSGNVIAETWSNSYVDYYNYKLGNCYKTTKEAELNRDKWIKFYESEEVLECV